MSRQLKITCISDLHGELPELSGGDLLIIAGDLTGSDLFIQYQFFFQWLEYQKYKTIIYIGGNHDGMIEKGLINFSSIHDIRYLQDSMTIWEDIKIWGAPWTPTFFNWHFMKDRGEDIKKKWDLIPKDTEILITHGPSYGILDYTEFSSKGKFAGCEELRTVVEELPDLKLHVFGHIHEGYGNLVLKRTPKDLLCVNASVMNAEYDMVNPPININYCKNKGAYVI